MPRRMTAYRLGVMPTRRIRAYGGYVAPEVPIDYLTRWGVVSHWKLNEASGNATDELGGNTLTDNNTVTSQTGKLGNARQFTKANSEYLSRADNASLSTGDIDFWFSAWVYADSLTAGNYPGIVSKSNDASNYEYVLFHDGDTNRLIFRVSPDGSATTNVTASAHGALSTATWYFVLVWHDSAGNTINIRVNHGTANSQAHTTGVADGVSAFVMGRLFNIYYWDGRIDSVTFGKSPPGGLAGMIDEISERLYNAASGRDYPFS